jgi:hypothetical protein
VLPEPEQRRELVAASGDEIQRLRFLGSTDELIFEARSLVETRPAPPLRAASTDSNHPCPTRRPAQQRSAGALEGWLPNGQHEPAAIDLTQEALMGSNQQTLAFLKQLIELIQERVKYTQRHVGRPGRRAEPCASGSAPAVIWPC